MGRRYDGVTAYTGMPGSGKTYSLVQRGLAAMERGIPVYTNAGFDVAGARQFESFEDFVNIAFNEGESVCLWDELPLYVNSRKWQEFPDALMYRLSQIRKDHMRLYYSAIDEDMVDVNVRRVTFWYWECRSITERWFTRRLYPPSKYRKANMRPYATERVRVNMRVAGAYDTMGKVAAPIDPQELLKAADRKKWRKLGPNSGLLVPEDADVQQPAGAGKGDGGARGTGGTRPDSGGAGGTRTRQRRRPPARRESERNGDG